MNARSPCNTSAIGLNPDTESEVVSRPYASVDDIGLSNESLLRQYWKESGIYRRFVDGEEITCVGEEYHSQFAAFEGHCCKLAGMKNPKIPFKEGAWRNPVPEEPKLGRLYHNMIRYLEAYSPRYRYSEHLEAAYRMAREFGFLDDDGLGPHLHAWSSQTREDVAYCNRYLMALATYFRSREFLLKLRDRKKLANRTLRRLNNLICSLLRLRSRLCVVRIDLEYSTNGYGEPLGQPIPGAIPKAFRIDGVKADINRFLNGLRQRGFTRYLLGYAWRLEFGKDRGYHIHFIAFFEGRKVRAHKYKANQIGWYWNKLAGQNASFHSCNSKISGYKRVGIGMIDRNDKSAVSNLYEAAAYLAKMDQLLMVRTSKGCKTFGSSKLESVLDKLKKKRLRNAPESNPLEVAPFDPSERYKPAFIRGMAVSKRNPVLVNARRYRREHQVAKRQGKGKRRSPTPSVIGQAR